MLSFHPKEGVHVLRKTFQSFSLGKPHEAACDAPRFPDGGFASGQRERRKAADASAIALLASGFGIDEEDVYKRQALARLRHIADLFLFHNRDILIRADDSVVRVESLPGECFSTDNNPQHYPQKNSIPSASSPSRPNGTSAGIPSPSAKNLEGWGAGGGNLSSENALPRESPPLDVYKRQG